MSPERLAISLRKDLYVCLPVCLRGLLFCLFVRMKVSFAWLCLTITDHTYYLSINLFACLSVCLSIYYSIYTYIYLPIYLLLYRTIVLPIYSSVYKSACLSMYESIYSSTLFPIPVEPTVSTYTRPCTVTWTTLDQQLLLQNYRPKRLSWAVD